MTDRCEDVRRTYQSELPAVIIELNVRNKAEGESPYVTIQQLEQRLAELERQVATLQSEPRPLRPMASVQDTFGMFANDPDFDEIVRLGREDRQKANSEDD